jgi:uncharacterized protein YyaL (SSP411 family)
VFLKQFRSRAVAVTDPKALLKEVHRHFPAVYVCENFTCKAPVTDEKALGELLKL